MAALGGHRIPGGIFQRFQREQKRWTNHGEIGILTPSEAGLDLQLQDIFLPPKFSLLTSELAPYIETEVLQNTSKEIYYSIRCPFKEQWTHWVANDQGLALLVLRLICFVFPRDRLWEPQ
jgi:hypothetical protein